MSKPIKYFFLICITAFLAAGVYLYKPISGGLAAMSPGKPCGEPMSFTIGTIDSRFSIKQDDVSEAARIAASLWNSGSDQVLLEHSAEVSGNDGNTADIVVHFVYDERQERTDGELRFREQIRSEQIRLDQLQARHDQKREQFEKQSQRYIQLSERTTNELDRLNEWVAEKNDGGGFTESEYKDFLNKRSEAEQKQKKVFDERDRLEQLAKTINNEMESLNRQFDENNRLIERYNEEFAGDMRFTKATYQRVGNGGVITVNQFMNKRELGLILAHEMGHALGLDHHSNPKSIMHSRMGAQDLYPEVQLTEEDRAAINAVCR